MYGLDSISVANGAQYILRVGYESVRTADQEDDLKNTALIPAYIVASVRLTTCEVLVVISTDEDASFGSSEGIELST